MIYDDSKQDWVGLLLTQSGRGKIAYWEGVRPQRGAGIGSILRHFIRLIPSFFNSPVGETLVKTGVNVAKDFMEGNSVKESLKTNAREAVRNLTGVGKTRKRKAVIGFIKGGPVMKKKVIRRSFVV